MKEYVEGNTYIGNREGKKAKKKTLVNSESETKTDRYYMNQT